MKLSREDQKLMEDVFDMDPEMAAYLTGGLTEDGVKIAFRAWMMLMLDVIEHGVTAFAKYESADQVVEVYGKVYMPEAQRVRQAILHRIERGLEESDSERASARAAHTNIKTLVPALGRTGTDWVQPFLLQH